MKMECWFNFALPITHHILLAQGSYGVSFESNLRYYDQVIESALCYTGHVLSVVRVSIKNAERTHIIAVSYFDNTALFYAPALGFLVFWHDDGGGDDDDDDDGDEDDGHEICVWTLMFVTEAFGNHSMTWFSDTVKKLHHI